MGRLEQPILHGRLAALVTHQAYYYLYGLYADYPLSNTWFREREAQARVREKLRQIQPLLWYFTPYRKSHALRLFTERETLARFKPELVDEAWRQLRGVIERLGPPPGWTGRVPQGPDAREAEAGQPAAPEPDTPGRTEGAPAGAGAAEAPRKGRGRPFPKPPIDYDFEA